MKHKIKIILIFLLVINCQIVLRAQTPEKEDSTVTVEKEKVNVLYGTQSYDRFVGNMSVVKGEDLKNYPSMVIMESLAGQLPGVFIQQLNGNPGEQNFNTFIRGNVGGYLILVDGVERSLIPYDMEQIEEIKVLKDPISKALYGGRMTNGIIMVTTKRGKNIKSEFHAKVQRGIKMPTSLPTYMNSFDFATHYNQASANDGLGAKYSQEELDAYQNQNMPLKYPDVDYYGQFLNKSMDLTRISTQYYGGNDKTKFYVHTGYQKEGGFEKYGENSRQIQAFNLQGNVDSKFSDVIQLHANISGNMSRKQYPGSYTHIPGSDGSMNGTYTMYPLSNRYPNSYPILVKGDSIGGTSSWKDNPYGAQSQSGYVRENILMVQGDIGFDVKLGNLVKGLAWKPNFSFDIYHKQNLQKLHTLGIYNIATFDPDGNPLTYNTLQTGKKSTTQSLGDDDFGSRWAFTNTISYSLELDKHALDVDLVYYISELVYADQFYNYRRQNLSLRTNYTYAGKYTLEGVLNYSGSQSFHPDKRFKYYPAVGAGWLISKEGFMSDATTFDFLKINASWGIMGDGNITPNMWRESWAGADNYSFNSSAVFPTTTLVRVGNPALEWPEQREIDLSIEARMFKKLGWKVSYFDYQQSKWLDIKTNQIPSIIGGINSLPLTNFGKTGLTGIEVELNFNGQSGDFKYAIGTSMTYGKSKKVLIDELPDPNYTTQGDAWDDIRGFQAIGKYTQADIDQVIAGTMAQPSYMDPKALRVGNIIYKNQNGDKVIDKYDNVIIGNSAPRLMYSGDISLNFKGFEVYALFLGYGEYKRNLNNNFYQIYSTRKYSTVITDGLPNGNTYPMLTTGASPNDFQTSDYWIVNGGYLKLQNVSLSYTLPKQFTKSIKMSDMKLFLYGTDLFTISKIKKSDPESLDAGLYDYPLFSTYALGVSISF